MYSHGCTGFAYAYAEGSLFYPRALPPKNMTLMKQSTKKHSYFTYNLWNSPFFFTKTHGKHTQKQ